MIWLAVFPTLTIINLALGDWLKTLSPVLRTFVLATIAVPIVIYGLMPQLHRLRVRLLTRVRRTHDDPERSDPKGRRRHSVTTVYSPAYLLRTQR